MLSSELLVSVLESAPDAIVIIDEAGRIVFANRQVSAVFGYESAEIVGQSIEMLMPERFRMRHVEHRRRYSSNVRIRPMGIGLDLFALHKSGTEFPVEISLSPVHSGERTLIAAAIRDVTERKQVQNELLAAREAADRANQAKSRFLATASHDLRQPLQTLSLLNGTLQRLSTDATILDVAAQQAQAIEAMSRLLNTLLDISKLESGAIKPELADFTVAAVFEELRGEFASIAASKGLKLKVDPTNECAHSDRSLVGQILRNLVSNAIKYTREGWVQLRCLSTQQAVRIEVLDTGIGIPRDQLAYIYDEFYQVGVPPNTVREGYGLGLSIVRRLVGLLGLKLDVQSEVGKGSTFVLELPAGVGRLASAPGRAAAPAPAQARAEGPHILLVEDDVAVRNATRMLLKVEGYRVTTADTIAAAVEQARRSPDIDLLVTDYHLSRGETGLQVITALREVLGTAFGTVLVTGDTSSAIKELRNEARLRIASKPIHAEELLALLRDLRTA